MSVLEGVEPVEFWRRFETLTTIARPSRHEEPVIAWVKDWAAGRGLELSQDAGRNLVIRVPATAGRETAPTLVLQGHLDMVCERNPDSANDPAEGRIVLLRDGDWLTADGTTLGADDGVAITASRRGIRRRGALEAFAWRAIVNAARDRRAVRAEAGDPPELAAPNAAEQDESVRQAIAELPERQRLTLFLRYFADLVRKALTPCRTIGGTLADRVEHFKRGTSPVRVLPGVLAAGVRAGM